MTPISHLSSAKKQLNLFNKYLLLVTFETDDNYSIRNEKNTIRTALVQTA